MFAAMIDALLPKRAATVQTLGHPSAGVVGWFPAAPADPQSRSEP